MCLLIQERRPIFCVFALFFLNKPLFYILYFICLKSTEARSTTKIVKIITVRVLFEQNYEISVDFIKLTF